MFYGAIEAGGTKFVCAVSREDMTIIDEKVIPTTMPQETLKQVFTFFADYTLQALGVGAFGPVDVNPSSATYGCVLNTPKSGWSGFDFLGTLQEHFAVPVVWTTDVNAAAFGEYKRGHARHTKSSLYLTVGTGIGGGVVMDGDIINGYGHPEIGHFPIRSHENDRSAGVCPFHAHCFEGLASGPAIEHRHGASAKTLANDRDVWDMEAYYLAQGIMTCTVMLRPEVIILGGGVMKQAQLFPLIRGYVTEMLNDYVVIPDIDDYIVGTGLGDASGITGCLCLALEAAGAERHS